MANISAVAKMRSLKIEQQSKAECELTDIQGTTRTLVQAIDRPPKAQKGQ